MTVNEHDKIIIVLLLIAQFLICLTIVIGAIKGEKRLSKQSSIPGFLFWPPVSGNDVKIVARKYKLIAITFAAICYFFSLFGILYIFDIL